MSNRFGYIVLVCVAEESRRVFRDDLPVFYLIPNAIPCFAGFGIIHLEAQHELTSLAGYADARLLQAVPYEGTKMRSQNLTLSHLVMQIPVDCTVLLSRERATKFAVRE